MTSVSLTPVPQRAATRSREELARQAVDAVLNAIIDSGTWRPRVRDGADFCADRVRALRPRGFAAREDWERRRLRGVTGPGLPRMVIAAPEPVRLIREMAAYARRHSCGNCGEMAALVFDELITRGARPVDYVQFAPNEHGADHAFVLLGRHAGTSLDFPGGWGADCWIVDAWLAGYIRRELRRAPRLDDGVVRAVQAKGQWQLGTGPESLDALFYGAARLSHYARFDG